MNPKICSSALSSKKRLRNCLKYVPDVHERGMIYTISPPALRSNMLIAANKKYRAALLPLGNLGPQNIVDLLAGRRGGNHTGIWKAGQEPQQRCGLKTRLTNALPRSDRDTRVIGQPRRGLGLPIVWLKFQNLPEEQYRVFAIPWYLPEEKFSLTDLRHRQRSPPQSNHLRDHPRPPVQSVAALCESPHRRGNHVQASWPRAAALSCRALGCILVS